MLNLFNVRYGKEFVWIRSPPARTRGRNKKCSFTFHFRNSLRYTGEKDATLNYLVSKIETLTKLCYKPKILQNVIVNDLGFFL